MPLVYSLLDLQNHDPNPKGNELERLFKCPVCGGAERSLHLNTQNGMWNCKRFSCGAKGCLSDFKKPYQSQPARVRAKAALNRTFALPAIEPDHSNQSGNQSENWRQQWETASLISKSKAGCAAIEARNLKLDIAVAAGVRFCPNWSPSTQGQQYNGGQAILYPLHDAGGQLQAVIGRYLQPQPNQPKVRTGGHLSQGAFFASADAVSPLARQNPLVILVEGPACALSLALCGFPTLAVGGCTLPHFLPTQCGLREVAIASDGDAAGENAALSWRQQLERLAARCMRLRSDELIEGAKDWNEALQMVGEKSLGEFLKSKLLKPQFESKSEPLLSKQSDEIHSLLKILNSQIEPEKLPPLIAQTTDEVRQKWLGLERENPVALRLEVLKLICLRHEIDFP